MLRAVITFAALLLGCALPAQVFPGVSADKADRDIKEAERAKNAGQDTVDRPDPAAGSGQDPTAEPPPDPNSSMSAAEQREARRKFADAMKGLSREQQAVAKHTTELLKGAYADTKVYATALADYHAEQFTKANTSLLRWNIPTNLDGDSREVREELHTSLKHGQALFVGQLAGLFSRFDLEQSSERVIVQRAKRAGEAAVTGAREMRNTGSRAPYELNSVLEKSNIVADFATEGEAAWVGCWQHYQKAKDTPWDGDVMWAFCESLYQPNRLELNLTQRLAIRHFMATFPDHPRVKDGEASVRLGWSLIRTWQFADAVAAMDEANRLVSADTPRTRVIQGIRGQMRTERTRLERGLLNIRDR